MGEEEEEEEGISIALVNKPHPTKMHNKERKRTKMNACKCMHLHTALDQFRE